MNLPLSNAPTSLLSKAVAQSPVHRDSEGLSRLDRLKSMPRSPGEASFFYRDPQFQYEAVKVLPGEYFVSIEDIMIMTVLGSCIAACIWDSRARLGGMNHFMLPDGDFSEGGGRYGSYAMELLINQLLKAGARREFLQAKVFGGAQVMAGFTAIMLAKEILILFLIIWRQNGSPLFHRTF